jgi:hypothetical protein
MRYIAECKRHHHFSAMIHWTIWNKEMHHPQETRSQLGRFTNSKWRAPEAPDLKIRKIYFYQKLITIKKKKRKKETKVIKGNRKKKLVI